MICVAVLPCAAVLARCLLALALVLLLMRVLAVVACLHWTPAMLPKWMRRRESVAQLHLQPEQR